MRKPATGQWGLGLFLLLFGLPFLGVGIGVGYWLGATYSQSKVAQSWVEVPATLEFIELQEYRDSDGDRRYRINCRFTYQFDGRVYESNQPVLSTFATGNQWAQKKYQEWKPFYDDQQPIVCYVNPEDPAVAVIDRDLDILMLFFLGVFTVMFGGAGLGMNIAGIVLLRKSSKTRALNTQYPDQPWMWNSAWRDTLIKPDTKTHALFACGFAIAWNLFSWPIAIIIIHGVLTEEEHAAALLVLLFPAIGVALLVWGIYALSKHRKYGNSFFKMQSIPGVVGGYLAGDLNIVGPLQGAERVEIVLRCQHIWVVGSGKHRQTHKETLWMKKHEMTLENIRWGQASSTFPVSFQIPYQCQPSDHTNSDDKIEWQVTAHAPVPGIDLNLAFCVPVYKTEASDPTIGESEEVLASQQAMLQDPRPPGAPWKIKVGKDRQGCRVFKISAWPGTAAVVLLLMVGTMLSLAPVVFFLGVLDIEQGTSDYWVAMAVTSVFGFIGVVLLGVVVSWFGWHQIRITEQTVQVKRHLILFQRKTDIPRAHVREVIQKETSRVNDKKYYGVYLVDFQDRKTKIGGGLAGHDTVQWLIYHVQKELGGTPHQEHTHDT